MAGAQASDWVADVLRFWFEELQPTQWFTKDPGLDELIRMRFLGVHERVAAAQEALGRPQDRAGRSDRARSISTQHVPRRGQGFCHRRQGARRG